MTQYPQGQHPQGQYPQGPYPQQQPPMGYPQQPGYPAQQLCYATPMLAGPGQDVGEIARRQRALMYCLLGYIGLIVLRVAMMVAKMPEAFGAMVLILAVAIAITASVFVFRLAMVVYGQGAGVALGICTLIPVVGLIILLVVNGAATNILRRHGISVGLMGADPRQIPPRGSMPMGYGAPPPQGYPPPPGYYPPTQPPPPR